MGVLDDAIGAFADQYTSTPDNSGGSVALLFGTVTSVAAGNVVTATTYSGETITAAHVVDSGGIYSNGDRVAVLVVNSVALLARIDGIPTPT